MAINKKQLTSFLQDFHLYYNDRQTFILKLQSFNLSNDKVQDYLRAVDVLMKHPEGLKHWPIALQYYRKKYRFKFHRDLDKFHYMPYSEKLTHHIETINETINTIINISYEKSVQFNEAHGKRTAQA
jgi:hypothetical protein